MTYEPLGKGARLLWDTKREREAFFFILYIITLIEFLGVPLKSLSRRWGGGFGFDYFFKN